MVTSPAIFVHRAALLVFLWAAIPAEARERVSPLRQPTLRSLYLSKNPRETVPEVYVAGQMVTTLRFETPCDPAQTKLLGWEGRFEPLIVSGRSVVLVPLQDLAPEDRFMLQVTLADGTSLPFTVQAAVSSVDAQLNVFPNHESPEALRMALEETSQENKQLREENQRREQEENSVDHALAALLAAGKVSLTPFRQTQTWLLQEEGLTSEVVFFEGKGRAAVLLKATNLNGAKPWKLGLARLTSFTTWKAQPFALRMTPSTIAPGQTGRIAIVADEALFDTPQGRDKLVLELFRDDGLRQAYLVLELRTKR